MRRILHIMTCVIGFALSWGMNAYAQDKVFFVPDPETARWSYLEMDGNGAPTATMVYSVDSMTGDAVNGSAKVKFERAGKQSSEETMGSFIYYKFKDGEFMVDMNAFFEGDALSSLIESAAGGEITGDSEAEKKKAIEEIKNMVRIIANEWGGANILITADHGFLYTYSPLNEDDKVDKTGFIDRIVEYGRRFAIILFPHPGLPTSIILCPPAAATSKARLTFSCPLTSAKSKSSSNTCAANSARVSTSVAGISALPCRCSTTCDRCFAP